MPCFLIHSQGWDLVKSLTCPNQSVTKGRDLKAKCRKLDMMPPPWHHFLLKTQKRLSDWWTSPKLFSSWIQNACQKLDTFYEMESPQGKLVKKKCTDQLWPRATRINPTAMDLLGIRKYIIYWISILCEIVAPVR